MWDDWNYGPGRPAAQPSNPRSEGRNTGDKSADAKKSKADVRPDNDIDKDKDKDSVRISNRASLKISPELLDEAEAEVTWRIRSGMEVTNPPGLAVAVARVFDGQDIWSFEGGDLTGPAAMSAMAGRRADWEQEQRARRPRDA